MIRNTVEKHEIKKEQKLARQFVMSAIMVVFIIINMGYFAIRGFQTCGLEIPTSYVVQACFIPIILALMVFYFFRLYRKNISELKKRESERNN